MSAESLTDLFFAACIEKADAEIPHPPQLLLEEFNIFAGSIGISDHGFSADQILADVNRRLGGKSAFKIRSAKAVTLFFRSGRTMITGRSADRVESGKLYEVFETWCRNNGLTPCAGSWSFPYWSAIAYPTLRVDQQPGATWITGLILVSAPPDGLTELPCTFGAGDVQRLYTAPVWPSGASCRELETV